MKQRVIDLALFAILAFIGLTATVQLWSIATTNPSMDPTSIIYNVKVRNFSLPNTFATSWKGDAGLTFEDALNRMRGNKTLFAEVCGTTTSSSIVVSESMMEIQNNITGHMTPNHTLSTNATNHTSILDTARTVDIVKVKFVNDDIPLPAPPHIPRKIWTFWDSDQPPQAVLDCVSAWKLFNPDHNVTIITHSNIHHYVMTPIPKNFEDVWHSFKSDWVRLAILTEQGGIWMDASVILTGTVSFVHNNQQVHHSEGFAYHLDKFTVDPRNAVIESWFIATIPGSRFISAWFNEFNKIFYNFNMDDKYLDHLRALYGEDGYNAILQDSHGDTKVMTIDKVPHPYTESAEKGPYTVLVESGWDDWEQVRRLVQEPWVGDVPPFFKLRGGGRGALVAMSDLKEVEMKEKMDKESVYVKFVKGSFENLVKTNMTVGGVNPRLVDEVKKTLRIGKWGGKGRGKVNGKGKGKGKTIGKAKGKGVGKGKKNIEKDPHLMHDQEIESFVQTRDLKRRGSA
ncbi:nucleotide-diphospho-sugar transferase [Chytridium lagenaria]|nr:nucleotide-diphospho-sugar transferase [Chytridium lagenaria]